MKEKFRSIRLSKLNQQKLYLINSIIQEYLDDGYKMTLRQLYYQLVSRDVMPNKQTEYTKLSKLLKEGRMAGEVDWDAIEDRLRVPKIPYWVNDPSHAISDTLRHYRLNRQQQQPRYLEVWVEKDALSGVLTRVTEKYHIRLLVNRGYGSITAIHDAYERMNWRIARGYDVEIIYLGDHDPSGMDMIRDIDSRIRQMLLATADFEDDFNEDPNALDFTCYSQADIDDDPDVFDFALEDYTKAKMKSAFKVTPIALTMDQIKQYNPPKNPTKMTDPRAKWYLKKFGHSSWELDALDPKVLNKLLSDYIESKINMAQYEQILSQEKADKKKIKHISENYNDIIKEIE